MTEPWLLEVPSTKRTLSQLLILTADRRGDDVLLGTPELSLTARDLLTSVRAAAGVLRSRGVGEGDRVAVMSDNRLQIVELMFAAGWLGAAFVPLNPALRGPSLQHQLDLSDPVLIVTDEESAAVLAKLDWALDDLAVLTWGEWPADVAPVAEPTEVRPDTTVALLHTSGTTGPAKAVQIPHGQLFWWSVVATEQMGLEPDDVLYTCLPLFHTNALTTFLQAMACDGRAVLGPKFSVSRHWDRLAEAGATVTYLLGAMGAMLWNRRPDSAPQTSVRRVLGGGMSVHLKRDFEEFFDLEVLEGFGMTELGVPIYTPTGDTSVRGMGIAHRDYEAVVVNERDERVGDDVPGELLIRSRVPHTISTGYWRNAEATVASRRNLWFHTGDVVRRGADGCFTFVDRKSDSVRRRGENISCFEVERALETLEGVLACAVYPVPSGLGDDEVMAAVVSTAQPLDPEQLIGNASEVMAQHALPRYLRFMEALPLTPNGKVRKAALKEDGITDDTWDRERP